jgi:histone-binding protein RBBP4
MTVQWFPLAKESKTQNLLLGTHTSGAEQEHLLIAKVPFNLMSNQDVDEDNPAVEVFSKFPHQGEVNKARYMPQKTNIIATQSSLCQVNIYNIDKDKNPKVIFRGHTQEGYGLSWNSLNSGYLLSSDNDGLICIWDTNSESLVSSIKEKTGGVQDVAWKDSNIFCSANENSSVLIWDTRTIEKPCGILEGHEKCVNCLDFNKINENKLATGSTDTSIAIWDLRNIHYKQCALEQHSDEVITLAWSPHRESLMASGDKVGKAMVWDLTRLGEEISKEDAKDGMPELIFTHGGHMSAIADLQWNPELDLFLASVDQQNILQIWKMDKSLYEENNDDIENIRDEDVE